QRSNHPGAGPKRAAGTNVTFGDGHVEWHALTPGESWAIRNANPNTDEYDVWWTPTSAAPASAEFLPEP
ncbi:MAG: hypothetical protein ACOC9P_02915, partial [bacterium]